MKASLQDFITKIFTQIKNNYGNVDNTSDADKPISTAQQVAFDKLNSNLDQLSYSEVSGGKNLARKNDWKGAANYVCLPDEPAINGAKPISIGDFPKGTYTVSYNCDLESGATQCSFRDADWNLVGTSTSYNKSGANSYTVTTTADAKYITLYCNNSTIELTNIQIEKGSIATEYRPYIKSAKSLTDDVNGANSGLDTLAYSDIAGGKNLFNGKIYNGYWDSSTGEKIDSTYWLCSDDLIKVEPNTNYIASGVDATTFEVVFFDSNKKAISQTSAKVSFATPINAKYIGIYFSSNGTYSNIQIEEGTTATSYNPYIPSVKMLADEVNQQNDSLEDYGLDNLSNVWVQGRINTGSHVDSNIGIYSNSYPCSNGDLVTIKKESASEIGIAWFYGSTFLSYEYAIAIEEFKKNAPTNANSFRVQILNSDGITPSTAGHIGVYINNAIDELKNDLAKLFSSNITGIKLNGSTLEVSFNNGTSVGKVSFEGITEEETIIS